MLDHTGQEFGNFRLVRLLGSGGFAKVYLGQHIYIESHQAAIKVLTAELSNKEEIGQFRQEASTMLSLHHPNIVRVTDFGITQDHTPYIVMMYAPNGTLRSRHPRGTRLPLSTVISYVRPIANALHYAHTQKRLIHRDIKPENILIGPNQEVLLSDFGIATIVRHTATQSEQGFAGTLIYSAPEQLQGKPRPASDQYSLGIMVYEWLTGHPPFKGTVHQLIFQHAQEPPIPLSATLPSITPTVEHVVLKALAKKPADRFATIEMFAQALETASTSGQFSSRASNTYSTSPHSSYSERTRPASPPPSEQTRQAPPPPSASSDFTHLNAASSTSSTSQSPYSTPPVYESQPQGGFRPQQPHSTPPLSQPQPWPLPTTATQQKPNHLPLLHGRFMARNLMVIGGFVGSLLLLTIPLFLSKSTMTSPTSAYLLSTSIWFLIALPISVLGGAIFGKWYGTLASLIYVGILYIVGRAVNPTVFTADATAIGFLSLLLATWIVGFLYERRSTRGCLGSIGIMLLGAEIFVVGLIGTALAIHPPSSFNGDLIALAVSSLLLAPLFAFFASIFERLIQVIADGRRRKQQC